MTADDGSAKEVLFKRFRNRAERLLQLLRSLSCTKKQVEKEYINFD
jgi:hypothetical protein